MVRVHYLLTLTLINIHIPKKDRKQAIAGQEEGSVGYHNVQNRGSLYCFLLFLAKVTPISFVIQECNPDSFELLGICLFSDDLHHLNVLDRHI